jgi:hypothetical protein
MAVGVGVFAEDLLVALVTPGWIVESMTGAERFAPCNLKQVARSTAAIITGVGRFVAWLSPTTYSQAG